MSRATHQPGLDDSTAEAGRLRALRELRALDRGPDPKLDRLARLAALLFKAPRAAIVLVDKDQVFLKAAYGLPHGERPRAGTLADIMVRRGEVVLCGDITEDPMFASLLPSLTQVDVRFFACAPLIAPGGQTIGLLSVGDPSAHRYLGQEEERALRDLADEAMDAIVQDAALAAAARRLDLAFEAGGLAEFEWEIGADRLLINRRMAALTGLSCGPVEKALTTILDGPVAPEDRERFSKAVRAALSGRVDLSIELRWIRPDTGETVWLSAQAARLDDGHPRVRKLVGILQDITTRKEEERRREDLAAELDHRVKNMLAAVQSVANQSARKTTSLDAFLKSFSGRLRAMASAHELLTATRWGGAYLRDVAAAELGSLAADQASARGPDIYLTPRAAGAVALALHELSAASLRDGAMSSEGGRVEVVWSQSADGGFTLDWGETGAPPATPGARDGVAATTLGEVAARELGGRVLIERSAGGVRARLEASAAACAPRPEPDRARTSSPVQPPPEARLIEHVPGDVDGLRVLIVEDSLLLALELEQGLSELGASVVGTAAEVGEAMRMISQPFDAAVLDANLNGESVMPVAQALRQMGRPFIFATGYADKAAPAGFDAPIVRKPYNIGQIARALAQVSSKSTPKAQQI